MVNSDKIDLKDGIYKFHAEWCGPCKQLAPVVDRIVAELGATLHPVNVDENPELAQYFGVRSIPAMFAVKDGQPTHSMLGNRSEAEVREFIKKTIS